MVVGEGHGGMVAAKHSSMKGHKVNYNVIGDAKEVGNIRNTLVDAFEAVAKI